jgi:hypothetical protein
VKYSGQHKKLLIKVVIEEPSGMDNVLVFCLKHAAQF